VELLTVTEAQLVPTEISHETSLAVVPASPTCVTAAMQSVSHVSH